MQHAVLDVIKNLSMLLSNMQHTQHCLEAIYLARPALLSAVVRVVKPCGTGAEGGWLDFRSSTVAFFSERVRYFVIADFFCLEMVVSRNSSALRIITPA